MSLRLAIFITYLCLPVITRCQEFDTPLGKAKVNKNICLRGELGWNREWLTSLGVSYVHSNVNRHSPASIVLYAAAEANYAGYRSPAAFYGYKAGFEFGGMLMAMAMELRNNTDFAGKDQLVFTPKIGLTLFGHANLYYGYNLFNRADNTFGISHNQFTLSVNLNRRVLKEPLTPSRNQPPDPG